MQRYGEILGGEGCFSLKCGRNFPTLQEEDAQQTKRSTEGIDEEVGVVAEQLCQQTANSQGDEESGRDKRYLQHVDGIAVAGA